MNLENTALVIIDLQASMRKIVGTFAKPYSYDAVLDANRQLMEVFANAGAPIFLVSVQPPFLPKKARERFGRVILEAEAQKLPNVYHIKKHGPDVFTHSDGTFEELLEKLDVKKLVFTGVSTSNGVIKSARTAKTHGFEVKLIVEATADKSLKAYHAALAEFSKMGRLAEIKDFQKEKERK